MGKKLLYTLATLLLALFLLPNAAFAKGADRHGSNPYTQTGATYARFSPKKKNKCAEKDYRKLVKMVEQANRAIDKAVKKAQHTPKNDVRELLNYIEGIVDSVMAYADAVNGVVVCDYVAYTIDGQRVMIDPLRVIPL